MKLAGRGGFVHTVEAAISHSCGGEESVDDERSKHHR
jgi:hypothetical protein